MRKRHNLTQDIASGARLVGGPNKQTRKSWTFEQLEARHYLSADGLASLVGPEVDLAAAYQARADELAALGLTADQVSAAEGTAMRPFDDPAFPYQWHLINTGEFPVGDPILQNIFGVPGEDINVEGAWNLGYTGEGVVVAVVDSGIQLDHPDLVANLHETLGYDAVLDLTKEEFANAGSANQMDPTQAHGTASAGLIGAVGNNGIGTTGVAYNATIVPIQFLDGNLGSADPATVRAISFANQDIDVYNHSWGIASGRVADVIPPDLIAAFRESVLQGRGGLGNIHVFSTGNDAAPTVSGENFNVTGPWDYAGYNPFANTRYTIAVSGVDHDGQYSNVDGTVTPYPEAGPSVLVAAPTGSNTLAVGDDGIGPGNAVGSGVWTLDFVDTEGDNPLLEGYNAPTLPDGSEADDLLFDRWQDPSVTSRFNGTSASAPMASGVIALMLEANPNLSYRDVQEILVRSARQVGQFEEPVSGYEIAQGLTKPDSWSVNRNEFYHQTDFEGPGTINHYDLFDNPNTDLANDFMNGAVGSGAVLVYQPDLTPELINIDGDENFLNATNVMDPALFANGAGYTVSMGRGYAGSTFGYGHGVVDAELAVKLAEQWTTKDQHLAPEMTWTTFPRNTGAAFDDIGPRYIGNMASNFLLSPGTFDSEDEAGLINTYFAGAPSFPMTRDAQFDFLDLSVPDGPDSTMSVEWVEFKFSMDTGDVDDLRITLVSPDGTQSELTQHFDVPEVPAFSPQHFTDPINPGGIHAGLVGTPPGDPGANEYTFSTNRHWGERNDSRELIDPATGEPQAGLLLGTGLKRGWEVHVENFGTGTVGLNSFELVFHGSPVGPETQRIQGSVGVDEYTDLDGDGEFERDGRFNFERWIQTATDYFEASGIMPEDGNQFQQGVFGRINATNGVTAYEMETEMVQIGVDEEGEPIFEEQEVQVPYAIAAESAETGLLFNRLTEIERVADTTQEAFAENVTVQLFAEYADGEGGYVPADLDNDTPVDQFITGADGNYYFDVLPPVALEEAAEGEVVSYVVAIDDGENRAVISEDVHAPEGFLPKYKDQWRITQGYFKAWDNQGVTPTLTGNDIVTGITDAEGNVVQGLFDAEGNPVTERVINEETGVPEFLNNLGDVVDPMDFQDENENPLLLVEISTPGGNVTTEVLVDPTLFNGQVENFDPLDPEAAIPESTIITAGDDPSPVVFEPEFMFDGVDYGPSFIILDPDPESFDFTIITDINPDYTYTSIEVTVEDDEGTLTWELEDPEEIDGEILELYDTISEQFVSLEFDVLGTPIAYSTSAVRTEIQIAPIIETYDLESFPGALGPTQFVYDPSMVHTVLADENGDPIPMEDPLLPVLEPSFSNIRNINFLVDPGEPGAKEVTFEGRVFTDNDGNGVYDPFTDVAKNDVRVYQDVNRNGFFEAGIDLEVLTDADGTYSLTTQVDTTQAVALRVAPQAGFSLTTPSPEDEYVELVQPGDGLVGTNFDFAFGLGGGGGGGDDLFGVIAGSVFEDLDADGVKDPNERNAGGITVYVDQNGNGQRDQTDPFAVTNGGGFYEIAPVEVGQGIEVRVVAEAPLTQTLPADGAARVVTVVAGQVTDGVVFGVDNPANRDYGDLGTVNGHEYPTLAADNGPSHVVYQEIRLGATIDGDLDGQPSGDALGDDDNSLFDVADDEDGVLTNFGADDRITPGETLGFEVTVAGTGFFLNGWIDWNADGDWDDPGEQVFEDVDLNPGTHASGGGFLPQVTAPQDMAVDTPLAARFRWGPGELSYTGPATAGEVEDYVYNDPSIAPQVILGDYDDNGVVNTADYGVWKTNYGAQASQAPPGGVMPGDGNRDGVVDMRDYVVWRDGMAMQQASGASAPLAANRMTGSNSQMDAALAALGYERVTVTVGYGARAREISLWAPIQRDDAHTTTVAADDTPTVDTPLAPAWLGYSEAVVTSDASLGGPSVSVSPSGSSAADASRLDLALALLDGEKAYDEESFDFVARGEAEDGEEDAERVAVAAALEEAFASV